MSKFTIISDGGKLNAYIVQTKKQYETVQERLHVAAVSAIWFAATHGQPGPLNLLNESLKSNDQQALKLYIRRTHAIIGLNGEAPDGLTAELVSKAVNDGAVFGYADKQFTIVNGHTSAQAKALVTLCEKRFINPDGKEDRMVFDRNNFSEVQTLGDMDVLKRLITLAKSTEADTDTRKVAISAKVKKMLASIKDQAEVMLNQFDLAAKAPAPHAPAPRTAMVKPLPSTDRAKASAKLTPLKSVPQAKAKAKVGVAA